jgi:serine protease AprX
MRHEHLPGGTCSTGATATGTRSNALWGKKRRRYPLLVFTFVVVAACVLAGSTAAGPAPSAGVVPDSLREKAKAHPTDTFDVVIQTTDSSQLDALGATVRSAQRQHPGKAKGLTKKFKQLASATAEVTGDQISDIAAAQGVVSVTEDAPIQATSFSNLQNWPTSVGAQWGDVSRRTEFPTIAIVDSGVEQRSDFGKRLLRQVDLTTSGTNSWGDGFGHGTLVAGLAVGGADRFTGVEPHANIVSLDVLDDAGNGRVSNLLAACDWILQNKRWYNIDVANFSLNASSGVGVQNDPVDRAVEKLWLNGVVVVTAAGNYATDGADSGVGFAPANDPFVITVGASDTNGTVTPADDFAAPWSAWGSTQDGFHKPELAAPGRMLNGPVPMDAAMLTDNASHKVADGYMWMSGTSFAAPIVAGAAATVLSRHPDWTPDQVKGALMVAANVPTGYPSTGALGVGTVNIPGALAADGRANPNAGLDRFIVTDPATGLKTFDSAGWSSTAATDPDWNAASWSSASWSSASWSSASWTSASWSSASWSSASWSSASWSSASWTSMSADK